MKIGVPVKCQNGHRATAYHRVEGLDTIYLGVPEDQKCACPKHDIGMGWFQDGKPFVVEPPALGGEPEVLAWMFKQHDQSPFGKPSQHIAFSSEELTEAREGLVGIGMPREEYFDWQALVDRSHVTRLQAEVERLKQLACDRKDQQTEMCTQINDLEARNAELERLLRKQAEHIVILAENTLSYSSGIGSPIKTKEVNDAVYVALMHQQAVNAALAEGKEHE